MTLIDRAILRKDLDELDDKQFLEFQKLILPYIQKKAQEGSHWTKELLVGTEPISDENPKSNTCESKDKSL